MKDSFGREINYLRISITDRCNLRCKYCMPEQGIENKVTHKEILSFDEIYRIAKVFTQLGVNKIRLTGGEPLARKGVVELVRKISSLEGLEDLAMTTNGILLAEMAKELKDAGLNRVNISLDTLVDDKYEEITRVGNLSSFFKGLEEAKRVGLTPIKMNVVLIGGFNDDEILDFVNMTRYEEIDIRFIELMPIGESANWSKQKFISNETVLEKAKNLVPVPKKDPSSPANYYKLPDGKGRVGFINPISCKFCDNCNRVRITSTGKLKLCLHSNREIDLRDYLHSEQALREKILQSIGEKEESHHLEDGEFIKRNMNQIGG